MRLVPFAAAPVAVSLLLAPAPLSAQSVYELDRAASHVAFLGRAFTQRIAGRSTSLQGGVLLRGRDVRTVRGDVRFTVASIQTDPRSAQNELTAVFGGDAHPEIIFFVDSTSVEEKTRLVSLHGQLSMHGEIRPVRFDGSAHTLADGSRVVAEGVTRIDMRDWGMTPPSGLLGLVRMSPELTLAFRAEFTQKKRRGLASTVARLGTRD
ncbi:MAG: YceI family protein [Gemmatimonadaceae bacterium]